MLVPTWPGSASVMFIARSSDVKDQYFGDVNNYRKYGLLRALGHAGLKTLVVWMLTPRAISQADLVITPMRATTLDATVGGRALQLVAEEEEALGRTISQAVIFTMTRAIRTRQHAGIEASLEAQGVDIIRPPLLERVAFSALFQFGGNLRTLPAQGNMEAAIDNASHFAQAVYLRLTGYLNERP